MRFKYSNHALEQIQNRQLDKAKVDDVLNHPEKQFTDETGLKVYHKTVQENDKYYLYRVFVNHDKKPPLVVTVYKTSKIEKYED
jgi:hypothetical protein